MATSILQNKLTDRHLRLYILVQKIALITHFALALHKVDADLLFPLGVFYFVRVRLNVGFQFVISHLLIRYPISVSFLHCMIMMLSVPELTLVTVRCVPITLLLLLYRCKPLRVLRFFKVLHIKLLNKILT